jgi:hypothetical protein
MMVLIAVVVGGFVVGGLRLFLAQGTNVGVDMLDFQSEWLLTKVSMRHT